MAVSAEWDAVILVSINVRKIRTASPNSEYGGGAKEGAVKEWGRVEFMPFVLDVGHSWLASWPEG